MEKKYLLENTQNVIDIQVSVKTIFSILNYSKSIQSIKLKEDRFIVYLN